MGRIAFPDELKALGVLSDDEAEAICVEECLNPFDDEDEPKVGGNWEANCFCDDCHLGQTAIYRLRELKRQCGEALKYCELTRQHNARVRAFIIGNACVHASLS